VRRLTRAEIKASLDSVWPNPLTLRPYLASYPDSEEMEDVTSFDPLFSKAQALEWSYVVDAMVGAVFAERMQVKLGGTCFQQNVISDICWNDFFTNYGRKVFRRPVLAAEAARLTSYVKRSPNSTEAIRMAINLLFRSPDFLFHLELGATQEALRVRLTDYEVANRISFATTGAPPDLALSAAADNGQLKTIAQLDAQARRLIQTSQGRQHTNKYYSDWLQLSRIHSPNRDLQDLVLGVRVDNLDKAYGKEIMDYVNYITWKMNGTFSDLMTRPIAFPRQSGILIKAEGMPPYSALAGVYGNSILNRAGFIPEGVNDPDPIAAPDHPGLLMRAGFLAASRFSSDPIARGVFALRQLLCDPLPTPDFSVINARLDELEPLDPLTMANHQIVSKKTSPVSCMSCHSRINPLGFSLEGFDPLGKPRPVERVYDMRQFYKPNRGVVATHALPLPVLQVDVGGSVVTIANGAALSNALATSKVAQRCMATFALRHFDRRKENIGDSCSLSEAAQTLERGQPLVDMFVRSIANEDTFWRRK
jgi:hypothetical protein